MLIHIDLKVKFRIFGITIGTVTNSWDLPFQVPFPLPGPTTLIQFNERGVYLKVTAQPIGSDTTATKKG